MLPPLVDWTGWSAAAIDGFGPRWRELATGDFALRGRASAMTAPPRRGALTAKFALGGIELYRVGATALAADDDGWVVLGAGERYASSISPGPAVATLALFFDARTVATARRVVSEPRLLDDPAAGAPAGEPLPIGRRRLAYDRELAGAVAAVALDAERAGIGELHAIVLERILDAAERAHRERIRLPCVRAATRAEIHARVTRAYDYMMTAYAEPLELADLAQVAAMAPHHFLRRFRDVFGMTPHRALINRRIAVAHRLLVATDATIGDIAGAVGFAGLAAFSARFRRETGRSPREVRRETQLRASRR